MVRTGEGNAGQATAAVAGRFAHEAAAVSKDRRHVYLTEDNFAFASGFYRYTPPDSPKHHRGLRDGGRLQMLRVKGIDNADLALSSIDIADDGQSVTGEATFVEIYAALNPSETAEPTAGSFAFSCP